MVLYIDTKDKEIIRVSLKKEGKIIETLSEENEYGSQVLLQLILKLLRTSTPGVSSQFHSWSVKLEGIEVEKGPGSFTGLRVGVAVANALGYALGIPVNGKKMETDLVY